MKCRSQVVDGRKTWLRLLGSHFRPVAQLRCGFASREKRRRLLTHRIPTWAWPGRVRCSTSVAEMALRSFVM